ncbi:DNA polymerase alpha/epsilon subunit B-domain-containing protein [Aspergillus minisclerotigenes]|uniref:DNA polymerase epsilon subunit B n=1 Tax=Aspergillus minisclerotigenes TaxID=656917 RepID=A0A5N6IL59_9EURO|nr:DNA polymerase alpha/epsilon subunit B-domain-containing protein [Aspergillus minisclerotigenes]
MMDSDPVPSSSPAFATPAHPLRKNKSNLLLTRTSILPILLPPSTLRPVAFRTFTRKHNLTISSSALQTLATFVGKNCGSGWREEGLAERVLDEVAKSWKKAGGGVIVEEGKGASLKTILQTVEGNMSGGRVVAGKTPTTDGVSLSTSRNRESMHPNLHLSPSVASTLGDGEHGDSNLSSHPRSWIKVVDAFDIPRLTYNADKKYFEVAKSKASLFPQPSHKTALFRDRYNVIHQRLLRNESFQLSLGSSSVPSLSRSSSSFAPNKCYKLTPVANLLGRSGTSHLILGMLSVSPTGDLSLTDLTGSIALELSHARMIPENGAWFAPGMIVLVDGIYEEEENVKGSTLGGNTGVGGAIGGIFVGVSICGPPCERREMSLGTKSRQTTGEVSSSGGFGWVDFLGVGSERARGPRMRHIQARCLQNLHGGADDSRCTKIAIMSEVNLDHVKTVDALKRLFGFYSDLAPRERPIVFVLIGNFVQKAMINGGGQAAGIEYKEYFDSLAMGLSEFPSLLQHSTFIFVPGDNDPWSSAFSAGAASAIPRQAVPELFTSRVKRAFATANAESDRSQSSEPIGEAIWTTNPSRITLFGPVHDIAIVRDDISGRLRRNAVSIGQNADRSTVMDEGMDNQKSSVSPEAYIETQTPRIGAESYPMPSAVNMSRKLVKTILDQGTMSPFPLSLRPVLWDYASSLQLYPLPSSFILADPEAAPFCMTYEGCHVMNPGKLIPEGDLSSVRWIEYDVSKNRGKVRELRY